MVLQDARRSRAFPGKQSRNKDRGLLNRARAKAPPHGLMPRFIAVKCAGCDLYQVHGGVTRNIESYLMQSVQEPKNGKWACRVCSAKNSVVRVRKRALPNLSNMLQIFAVSEQVRTQAAALSHYVRPKISAASYSSTISSVERPCRMCRSSAPPSVCLMTMNRLLLRLPISTLH